MAALLLWNSPTVTCLRPPAGWRPAAVRPLCSCRGTGNPARRPGQRDQAAVGGQRHPELLHTVTGVPTQRLCSIVSRWNLACFCLLRWFSDMSKRGLMNILCTLICTLSHHSGLSIDMLSWEKIYFFYEAIVFELYLIAQQHFSGIINHPI